MAWATTRFIEEPIRFGKLKKVKPLAIAVSLGLVGLMGTVVWSQHGMSERSVAQDGANLGLERIGRRRRRILGAPTVS